MIHEKCFLALIIVGILVLPAAADLTLYAPGSPYTPAPPKVFAVPGVTVNVPIYLAGTGAAIGCDLQLQFNTIALQIDDLGADITPGSIDPSWAPGAFSPSPGVVNVGVYGDESIQNPSGSILNILFHVLPSAPAGPWTVGLYDYNYMGWTFLSGSISPTGPGDANLDGRDDINDLTRVLTNYNSNVGPNGWTLGDFNGDGTVDINDLTIVLANYNRTYGASPAGAETVPEPMTVVLLGIGAIGLLAFAWRRHTR